MEVHWIEIDCSRRGGAIAIAAACVSEAHSNSPRSIPILTGLSSINFALLTYPPTLNIQPANFPSTSTPSRMYQPAQLLDRDAPSSVTQMLGLETNLETLAPLADSFATSFVSRTVQDYQQDIRDRTD